MSKVFNKKLSDLHTSGQLEEAIKESYCLASVVTGLMNYSNNGRYTKLLKEFCITNCIDISHFTVNGMPRAVTVTKICPVCKNTFTKKKNQESTTCSHECGNKFFAYKQGAKNLKDGSSKYKVIIEDFYVVNNLEIKCCACEERDILDVHHIDGNRVNNSITNLVFLCPTDHAALHRISSSKVQKAIDIELKRRHKYC